MKQNDFPTPAQLKSALRPLSPAFERQTRERLLALRENKEERPVKKKLSAGLVLAIVLVLITCFTALALTQWREEIDELLQLQNTVGYFDEWGLEEKLLLLDMMEKNGVEMDARRLAAARDPEKEERVRSAAADAIIASRYGVDERADTVTVMGILEKEMGAAFWDWSIEDMAWYSQTELKYQNASPDAEVFTLPGEGDLTQAEALTLAKAALKEYRKIDMDQAPGAHLRVQYVVYPYMGAPLNQPEWRFEWQLADETMESVCLSPAGEVNSVLHTDLESPETRWYEQQAARKQELLERVGPEARWSLEDYVYYDPGYYRLPAAGDIAPEKAVEIAREALIRENTMTGEELAARDASLALRLTHVTPEGKWQYIYTVFFTPRDAAEPAWDCYVNLYTDSGEIQRSYRKVEK